MSRDDDIRRLVEASLNVYSPYELTEKLWDDIAGSVKRGLGKQGTKFAAAMGSERAYGKLAVTNLSKQLWNNWQRYSATLRGQKPQVRDVIAFLQSLGFGPDFLTLAYNELLKQMPRGDGAAGGASAPSADGGAAAKDEGPTREMQALVRAMKAGKFSPEQEKFIMTQLHRAGRMRDEEL